MFIPRILDRYAALARSSESSSLVHLYAAYAFAQPIIFTAIYYYAMRVRKRFSIVWQLMLMLYSIYALCCAADYDFLIPLAVAGFALSRLTWFTMARYSSVMFWLVTAAFQFVPPNLNAPNPSARVLLLAGCGLVLGLISYSSTNLKSWFDGLTINNQTIKQSYDLTAATNTSKQLWAARWFKIVILLVVIVFTNCVGAVIANWLRLSDISFLTQYEYHHMVVSICSAGLIILAVLPIYYLADKSAGYKILTASMLLFSLWAVAVQYQWEIAVSAITIDFISALKLTIKALCILELAKSSFVAFCIGSLLMLMQGGAHILIGYLLGIGGFDLLWRSCFIASTTLLIAVVTSMRLSDDNSIIN